MEIKINFLFTYYSMRVLFYIFLINRSVFVKDMYVPNFSCNVHYFFEGTEPETLEEKGSDGYAVSREIISISPVAIHPADHKGGFNDASFWKGGE